MRGRPLDDVDLAMIRRLRMDDGYSMGRIAAILGVSVERVLTALGQHAKALQYRDNRASLHRRYRENARAGLGG